MTNQEIEKHKILKQAAHYSYDVNKYKIPNGYNLIGIGTYDNGFYACVLKNKNDIIISYRGTNTNSWNDIKNDILMGIKLKPEQANNALSLYDKIRYEYPNCNIILTGHSLGGSLAQVVAATRDTNAVTFNAYGTKDFLEKYVVRIFDKKITNYCNPRDWVTTRNAKNHIGKCYEINSNDLEISPHKLEKMQPLENRILSSPENLQGAWHRTKQKREEFNYYRKTGKHTPIRMGSLNENQCSGSYPVSGYTRHDGTKVDGYIRTCYIHGK